MNGPSGALRVTQKIVLPLLLAGLAACASAEPVYNLDETESGGLVISRTEIEASGARNAMEVIQRAQSHLTIQRTREGSPERVFHRGIDSFLLSGQVLVVVDGTRVALPTEQLRAIPAASIRWIQILSAREAAVRFGSSAGNGVIMVMTSAR